MGNNKKKYIDFCRTHKSMCVFNQNWWLDSVCGDLWDVAIVEKGGKIYATMPYLIRKKFGLVIVYQPILTQTLGIYFNYPEGQKYYKKLSFEKEMINKIIEQLPNFSSFSQSFNYTQKNILPFYWNGFNSSVLYTYVIENTSIEELENNCENDVRRRKKKAAECGVKVYESNDIGLFYELNKKTFIRQKRKIPYSFEFIKRLYENAKKQNACKMYFARDTDGEVIAANFLVYDDHTVYYLMGGIKPDKKDLGGMDVVQFTSIKFALESGRKFDFEGSVIESIEKYFRSFGAIQKPYFHISKTNSKLLKIRSLVQEIIKC